MTSASLRSASPFCGSPLAGDTLVSACAGILSRSRTFRAPSARESLSLCVAKEKVTQEKGHPAWRFPGILPGKCVRAGRVFRRYVHVPSKKARPPVEPPAGLLVRPSPPHRGPRRAGGPSWTALGAKARSGGLASSSRSARRMRARFWGPLCGGETETTGRVSGHRQEADAFSTVQGGAAEKPGSGSRTFHPWMGGKRQAGWPFSWVTFSLATQRESDSAAEGRRKLLAFAPTTTKASPAHKGFPSVTSGLPQEKTGSARAVGAGERPSGQDRGEGV